MNTVAELIATMDAKRIKLGMSVAEVARRAGVAQPTAHRILSGESKSPRIENIRSLAVALGIDTPSITGALNVLETGPSYSTGLANGPRLQRRVPVISWVQAGQFCEAVDLYAPDSAEEWLDCPFPHSPRAFCLVVKGLSMHPDYRPEEIILVEPELEAQHNDDVVVRTPDGEATFKRLQQTEDGKYLLALNPEFPNRIIAVPDETIICGVVTGSWINRKRR